jgi:hypothetical protein
MVSNDDGNERPSDDLLRGARAIGRFMGLDEDQVYYAARVGKLPIGKDGVQLIGSKKRLARHAQKITAPQKIDAA